MRFRPRRKRCRGVPVPKSRDFLLFLGIRDRCELEAARSGRVGRGIECPVFVVVNGHEARIDG